MGFRSSRAMIVFEESPPVNVLDKSLVKLCMNFVVPGTMCYSSIEKALRITCPAWPCLA